MQTPILPSISLEAGVAALQQTQYQDAIGILEAFCHDCAVSSQCQSREYLQAQMHLVEIYAQTEKVERALALCCQLRDCENAQVQIWARQTLQKLTRSTPTSHLARKLVILQAFETLVMLLRRKTV